MTNSICKNHCPLNNTNDKNPSYCHSIYVMNCNTYKTFKIKQDICPTCQLYNICNNTCHTIISILNKINKYPYHNNI